MSTERRRKNSGRGRSTPRKPSPRTRGWFWPIFCIFFIWFLTGIPFTLFHPEMIKVEVEISRTTQTKTESDVSYSDLAVEATDEVTAWARNHGIDASTLSGALKAASVPRNSAGQKVLVWDLLALPMTESDPGTSEVNPETSNPTGRCLAWWEIGKRLDLSVVWRTTQELNLKRIADDMGLDVLKIYGSCGAGALGFNQAMPDNWWNLMGAGFNPWSRADAAEFSARYLVIHGYFENGRGAAIQSYNPGAPGYGAKVLSDAETLQSSFEASSLAVPDLKSELAPEVNVQPLVEPVTAETKGYLSFWPVKCPDGYQFGVFNPYQTFSPIGHTGRDLMCPLGTNVRASGAGVVEYAGWWPEEAYWKLGNIGYGNTIWLYHGMVNGKPLFTVYAHLSEINVEVGQRVSANEIIAETGDTGAGSSPHLHFEVRLGGGIKNNGTDEKGRVWDNYSPVDPTNWIDNENKTFVAEMPIENGLMALDSVPNQAVTETSPAIPVKNAGQKTTVLILKKTPAVELAVKLGNLLKDLEKIQEAAKNLKLIFDASESTATDLQKSLDSLNKEAEKIGLNFSPLADNLKKAKEFFAPIQQVLDVIIRSKPMLENLHLSLSRLAIAGQDRSLGLDPLFDWRLSSPEEVKK